MSRHLRFFCLLLALAPLLAGEWQVEEKEEIRRTFLIAAGQSPGKVIVDNINGAISIKGHPDREIQLIAQRHIFAESAEKLAVAREKVTLDISEMDDLVEFYVNSPERSRYNRERRWQDIRPGYKVVYDFELQIPQRSDLYISTVNDGHIKIEGVRGQFEVENINGGVEMRDIGGAGRAYALNGGIIVEFASQPEADAYIGSLNGHVKVAFPKELAADFRLKTFNGEVYSDFPVTYITPRPPKQKKSAGKFVYQSDGTTGVRIGKGGPEIELDAFNGDIFIIDSGNNEPKEQQ